MSAESDVATAKPEIVSRTERWSLAGRFLFRLAFIYLVLYCWPSGGRANLLEAIPDVGPGGRLSEILQEGAQAPVRILCSWTAVHLFHLSGPVTQYQQTGSGDTTLDYIQVFCFALIALTGAIVWTLLDRSRPNYLILYAYLRLIVRITLAITLINYGFAKIFPLQFSPPHLTQLVETYGDSSPMGLLWTFMGASDAYRIFAGAVELLGGFLLLFRRTTAVGALFSATVLLNVVLLNFCFDVPVKLYSCHLFLTCVFLLAPDLAALWRFFFAHRLARLEGVWLPRFERRGFQLSTAILQAIVILSVLFNFGYGSYSGMRELQKPASALTGVWDVAGVDAQASSAPASGFGPAAWQEAVFEDRSFGNNTTVRAKSGNWFGLKTEIADPKAQRVKLATWQRNETGEFTFAQPDAQHLVLTGVWDGLPATIRFNRYKDGKFLLTSRGFHWISEFPFNR
jgi:uncharacterized membrane protein YphA (DoxX/SURF4 family)